MKNNELTTAKNLEKEGIRTWYGGTNLNADTDSFKKEWGIDTSKYLIPLKYPSKSVITEALNLYVNEFRKPSHTVFCLDVSGSMSANNGLTDLQDAMDYILNKEEAGKDLLQFSNNDKINIIAFNSGIQSRTNTYLGSDTTYLIDYVNNLNAYGGTNIYAPSIEALKILEDTSSDEYTRAVILMTDGESNNGTYSQLANFYNYHNLDIPIYSIMFGSSNEEQLEDLAELSNGKVFDGKEGLKEAFKEVRSYN